MTYQVTYTSSEAVGRVIVVIGEVIMLARAALVLMTRACHGMTEATLTGL